MNYNEIREEAGRRLLFDSTRYGQLSARLDELAGLLKEPRKVLEKYGFPCTQEWQKGLIENGVEGLEAAVVSETDKQATRLGIPAFVSREWRQQAVKDVPAEAWKETNAFANRLKSCSTELPVVEGDISYTEAGDPVLDAEAVQERIKIACSREVTPRMQEEADQLRDIIEQLRRLDAEGVNVQILIREFLGNRYAPSKHPSLDDLSLMERIRATKQQTAAELLATNPNGYFSLGGDRPQEEVKTSSKK